MRHKAQKPTLRGRYAVGQKRCQICELFMKWEGLHCPCCGYRLRTKPRNLKNKARLRTITAKEKETTTAGANSSSVRNVVEKQANWIYVQTPWSYRGEEKLYPDRH